MKVTAREMPIFLRLASPLAKRVGPRGAIAQVGPAVLVISLIARVAAMTAAQSFGFFSWPIFQTVFADATPGPRSTASGLVSRWLARNEASHLRPRRAIRE